MTRPKLNLSDLNIHDHKAKYGLIFLGTDALCRHIPHGRAAVRSAQLQFITTKTF